MNSYQPSFFDEAERLAKLTRLKDPLEALKRHIDFEIFRPQLAVVFDKDRKSAAGRKAYDVVLMFKILICNGSIICRMTRRNSRSTTGSRFSVFSDCSWAARSRIFPRCGSFAKP